MNDDLGLQSALREALDGEPVHVHPLLDGVRRRAERIRRRRQVAATGLAVLLIGSAPVGLALVDGAGRGAGIPVAEGSHAVQRPSVVPSEPVPSDATALTAEAAPTSAAAEPLPAPTQFPDAAALQPEDFHRPLDLVSDAAGQRGAPPVPDQICGQVPADRQPVSHRRWMWSEPGTASAERVTVQLTLTGWPQGQASAALADVRDNDGACRFAHSSRTVPGDDLPGPSWVAAYDGAATGQAYAVLQVGEVLVAVAVTHPDGADVGVQEATRFATVAAERVEQALG